MAPGCPRHLRVEFPGCVREIQLSWSYAELDAETGKLPPLLARDGISQWVCITVKVCYLEERCQGYPLWPLHKPLVRGHQQRASHRLFWERKRGGEGIRADEDTNSQARSARYLQVVVEDYNAKRYP